MTPKIMGRWIGMFILAVGFVTANSSPIAAPSTAATADRQSPDPMLRLEASLRAERLAQESFPRFLSGAMGRTGATLPGSAVRVRGTTDTGADGLFWVERIAVAADGFTGQDLSDPARRHAFTLTDIVDWSHAGHDGRLHGNFGAREIAAVLPAQHAAQIVATLSIAPYPRGW